MKKKIIVAFSILCMSLLAHSQVNPNALGLRLGGGDVNGAEFSYQKGLGSENRLEIDLGFGGNQDFNRMNLGGIYHWVWNITSGLNWYVGPGAMAGLYKYKNSDGRTGAGSSRRLSRRCRSRASAATVRLTWRRNGASRCCSVWPRSRRPNHGAGCCASGSSSKRPSSA